MKKYSVAVCACAVLFSVGIHGGGMRETDEVSYYLGIGMSLWYTGTEEYIEGRNCPVFVLGTDHEDHFTKEHYYAVGDNVVYYYDPSGDAWLLLGAG